MIRRRSSDAKDVPEGAFRVQKVGSTSQEFCVGRLDGTKCALDGWTGQRLRTPGFPPRPRQLRIVKEGRQNGGVAVSLFAAMRFAYCVYRLRVTPRKRGPSPIIWLAQSVPDCLIVLYPKLAGKSLRSSASERSTHSLLSILTKIVARCLKITRDEPTAPCAA